ncbi:MAG: hypothetical protein FJX46_16675, partial [Alphaproteobacteria bacterium]|nr:hypothetical protein [Alphaproteobacteria bacterium]
DLFSAMSFPGHRLGFLSKLIISISLAQENPVRSVDQELWNRVRERQAKLHRALGLSDGRVRSERARRPAYLLSGLLVCGACGGHYVKISKHHYGCSQARFQGTCDNRLTVRRDSIEASVTDALRTQLMDPALFKQFVAEYARETNRILAAAEADTSGKRSDLAKTERQITAIIEAIKDGLRTPAMKAELERLEAHKQELVNAIAGAQTPAPRLHPNMAELYRAKVANLQQELSKPELRVEAAEAIRSLIGSISLLPSAGSLAVQIDGQFPAMLALAQGKNPRQTPAAALQITTGSETLFHAKRESRSRAGYEGMIDDLS